MNGPFGNKPIGLISGENPRFPAEGSGHKALGETLRQMGLKAEPIEGKYGAPEKSWMVHAPSREQMYQLGKHFGQESVVYSNAGKHELLYTNGPNAGRFHPGLSHELFREPPEDYYSVLPDQQGYLRLNFDFDQLHPTNLGPDAAAGALQDRAQHEQSFGKREIAMALAATLRKALPRSAEENKANMENDAVLRDSYGNLIEDQTGRRGSLFDANKLLPVRNTKASLEAEGAARDYNAARNDSSLTQGGIPNSRPIGMPGSAFHAATTDAYWRDIDEKSGPVHPEHPNAYPWHNPHTDHALQSASPGVVLRSAGVDDPIVKSENDQAAGAGVSTYAKHALPFGTVDKSQIHGTDLFHYPLHGHNQAIDQLVHDHGYTPYYAGGKYGRPDLASRNYNTKHLMIYDPSPGSGGDFGTEAYTDGWRKIHELAHALTYPELNKIYGEGRRIGKLGTHRSMNEALRAVHWEHLATHKQRELTAQLGIHIPDTTFNKEYNTVMHDAVHRAVTGQFTEPSQEGFKPHEHKVPLETALGMVREAGHSAGLTGMHDTLKKHNLGSKDNERTTMTDDKLHEEQEWRLALAKGVKDRIDAYSQSLLELRRRELKKSLAKTEPLIKSMDACPVCKMEDKPGICKCWSMHKSEAPVAKAHPDMYPAKESADDKGTCTNCGKESTKVTKISGAKEPAGWHCASCAGAKAQKSDMDPGDGAGMAPSMAMAEKPASTKKGEFSANKKAQEPVKTQEGSGGKISKLKLGKAALPSAPKQAAMHSNVVSSKAALAPPAAAAKLPTPAEHAQRAASLSAFTPKPATAPSAAAPKLPSVPKAAAPAPGVGGLKPPPVMAAKPKGLDKISAVAKQPIAPMAAPPKPAAPKPAMVKMAKSEKCLLCNKPEHGGRC